MIKQHITHYIFLLHAVIILCLLTACSNNKSNIQLLDNPNTQPEYLSFFSSENISNNDVTKYWTDLFTKTYNKKVYINFDGATYYADEGLSYRELLEKRLKSSAPDDLYIINAEDVIEFENKGYWMDLSDMDFVNNLSEAALYQSTYNGKVFSLPLSFSGFGFVWNVDLLEQYSLAIPQNIEEFLEVCERLKTANILPYAANKGYALTVPAMCVGFSKLYQSEDRDAKIVALNNGETHVSDYMREGFDFLYQMIERGYLDPEQALTSTPRNEDVELFLSGKCAFICAGVDILNQLEEKPFQMKMTGLPILTDGCIAVYGANSRLCVNPNSKHLDTVYEFIKLLGTSESLEKSAELNNSMSSSKNNDINRFPLAQELVILLQQPNQIPNQDFALHFNTWESIRDVSREICSGISIDQACNMLDEKQQTDLKNYGNK